MEEHRFDKDTIVRRSFDISPGSFSARQDGPKPSGTRPARRPLHRKKRRSRGTKKGKRHRIILEKAPMSKEPRAKWEYRIFGSHPVVATKKAWHGRIHSTEDVERMLNQLGREGWEIIDIDFLAGSRLPLFWGAAKRQVDGAGLSVQKTN
jgi:hypothetical protein